LPFSSLSAFNKENYVSEEETSESEEEEPNFLLNNFLNNFDQMNFQQKKISRCKSFCRKLKKGYGCTKSTRVFEFGSLTCFKKQRNNELTTEKVLP
jgi:hypothetical protein